MRLSAIDVNGRSMNTGDSVRTWPQSGREGVIVRIDRDSDHDQSGEVTVRWKDGGETTQSGSLLRKLEALTFATDINGRQIRRGDRVRVVTDGSTATVIGDPDDAKIDLSSGGWAHPKKVEVLEAHGFVRLGNTNWFARARARVLEQRTQTFDFRRGRRRLLEQQRARRFGIDLNMANGMKVRYSGPLGEATGRVRRVNGDGSVEIAWDAGAPAHLAESWSARSPYITQMDRSGTHRFANVNDFPLDIRYQGLTWHRTGKVGTNRRTGKDAAEYESDDRNYRVWRDIDGNVAPE